jgi:hypothetical protein
LLSDIVERLGYCRVVQILSSSADIVERSACSGIPEFSESCEGFCFERLTMPAITYFNASFKVDTHGIGDDRIKTTYQRSPNL